MIADVLAYYAREAAVGDEAVARPKELLARIEKLLEWWGDKRLSAVNGFTCKAYAKHRVSASAARRELEDFRAAIGLYHADGLLRDVVAVTLPRKAKSRLTYFEREDVIALLKHCWRAKEVQRGSRTSRHHLRHLVPFILTAVYTGSRSAKIWKATYGRSATGPWIDLEHGVYHRLGEDEAEQANKRAGTIKLPPRLFGHMRRWQAGPLVDGERRPRRFLVEYRGRPADPKKALAKAMDDVFGADHRFVRHTFRHTAASWLIWAGQDLNEIAAYMSMTVPVLVAVYGHDHPDANAAVGRAFTEGRAGHRKGQSRRERGLKHAG